MDNPYVKLIHQMREQGSALNPSDVVIATVRSASPPVLRIDGTTVTADYIPDGFSADEGDTVIAKVFDNETVVILCKVVEA